MIIIIAPMTQIPAFLPAATCQNVKAVNGITLLHPCRNAQLHKQKKQRVIRKRITLCFLVKPFLQVWCQCGVKLAKRG